MEPGRNPVDDLDVIENELAPVRRPRGPAPAGRAQQDRRPRRPRHRRHRRRRPARARACTVFAVSAASGEGLRELTFAMAEIVAAARAAAARRRGDADRAPAAVGRRRRRLHRHRDRRRLAGARRRSPSAGCGRPTSATTRPSASSPTGSTGSASRRGWSQLGAGEGDAVLIGDPDNAVVFDFKPGIDAGAEMLGRRGEDQRFDEERPAAQRRRAIDEAMPDRAEGETRADVARRLDKPRRPGQRTRSAPPTTRTACRRPRTVPRTHDRRCPARARSPRPAGSWSRSARPR